MDRLIHSPVQLASLLKTTRKAEGLTQAALAARLGISQNRLSELEADAGALTVDRLLGLLQALRLELVLRRPGEAALGVEEPPAPPAW